MTTLADYLPEAEKHQFVHKHLKPGQILYLFCDFTTPPKEKYLVLACSGANPLLFLINSEIHPYIEARPELQKCQVKIRASDYQLDHDSYINCSRVIDNISETEIIEQVIKDTGRIKGELTEETTQEIIQVVTTAKTLNTHIKRLIIQALQESESA